MKAVAKALYSEPVIFLGTVQVVLSVLAAQQVITGWIPVASLGAITYLQRRVVSPKRR